MYRNTPQRQKRRSLTAPSSMHDLPEGPDICIKFVDLSANNVSDLTPLSRAPHRLLQEFRFLEKLDLSDNGLTEFPKELTDVSDYFIDLPIFSFYDLNLAINGMWNWSDSKIENGLLYCSKVFVITPNYKRLS